MRESVYRLASPQAGEVVICRLNHALARELDDEAAVALAGPGGVDGCNLANTRSSCFAIEHCALTGRGRVSDRPLTELNQHSTRAFVAYSPASFTGSTARFLGCVGVMPFPKSGHSWKSNPEGDYLFQLCVIDEFRSRGIGPSLIRAVQDSCATRVYLKVLHTGTPGTCDSTLAHELKKRSDRLMGFYTHHMGFRFMESDPSYHLLHIAGRGCEKVHFDADSASI